MDDLNQLQFELLTLRKVVEELQGSGMRSAARTIRAVLNLSGFLMVIFRWMSDAQMARFKRDWGSRLQAPLAVSKEAKVDAPRAALRGAKAAIAAAEGCSQVPPTLDMHYPDPKVRPLLGAYVRGNIFDNASLHPTTPPPSTCDITNPNEANMVTWKGLKAV